MKIHTFLGFTFRQKYLLLGSAFIFFYVYVLLKYYENTIHYQSTKKNKEVADPNILRDITLAIKLLGKYFPNYCLCRHQSVIARILLDLYHIDFKTFIGLRKEAELVGHAWTMVGTVFISGTCEPETYIIVATYS
jgi:Transglutaminase-like superfamily